MRIYLAGKVDDLGRWRDAILGTDRVWEGHLGGGMRGAVEVRRWHTQARITDDPSYWPNDVDFCWPTAPNAWVLETHHYTGPFRTTLPEAEWEHKGVFHGVEDTGQHGQVQDGGRIRDACLARIADSDLVFAYINSCDAFGTIAEIGYARALGKFVAVVESADAVGDDSLWFVHSLASLVVHLPRERYRRRDGAAAGASFEDGWIAEPTEEGALLRDALRDAIVRCAARDPRARADWRAVVGQSFRQIVRWTSDPRVRDEARRMIGWVEAGRG